MGLAAITLLASCTQTQGWFGSDDPADSTQQLQSEGNYKARFTRDESITRDNAYSDFFLDSGAVERYLKTANISGDAAERMKEFYLVRNNGAAWFTRTGLTEQARSLWSLYGAEPEKGKNEPAARIKDRMDSLVANDSALLVKHDTAARKDWSEAGLAEATAGADSLMVATELALTAQLIKMAGEANGVITPDNFYWLVPRKKMDALQEADSLLNKDSASNLAVGNAQYTGLKNALRPYYEAAKGGGWQPVTAAKGLKKGAKLPAVVLLKKRLAATGDYNASDTSNLFTDSLSTAIKNAQAQYGFAPTGLVTDSLLAELNVPATERLQQILLNMNRALWAKPTTEGRRLSINIPSLSLVAYGDSGQAMQMPVIVGKEGSSTLAFSGEISKIVFSPYWNLPQSIVQAEILPAMKADPSYLKAHNMEVVKQGKDGIPEIRQLPGRENSLGGVKFLFPNSFDIYLHDTPHKELFAQSNRALSHGCIRVAKPDSLALFVLQGQGDWTPEKISTAMNASKEQTVEVKTPVPVALSYYTAFVGEGGKLNFRKDVYGYDAKSQERTFIPGA